MNPAPPVTQTLVMAAGAYRTNRACPAGDFRKPGAARRACGEDQDVSPVLGQVQRWQKGLPARVVGRHFIVLEDCDARAPPVGGPPQRVRRTAAHRDSPDRGPLSLLPAD